MSLGSRACVRMSKIVSRSKSANYFDNLDSRAVLLTSLGADTALMTTQVAESVGRRVVCLIRNEAGDDAIDLRRRTLEQTPVSARVRQTC